MIILSGAAGVEPCNSGIARLIPQVNAMARGKKKAALGGFGLLSQFVFHNPHDRRHGFVRRNGPHNMHREP